MTGATIDVPEFTVAPGLQVREAFAHVFGTFMVAFAHPPHRGASHPGPWVAAQGGTSFNMTIEIRLAENARPTQFDRLNSIWWLVSLLRLRTGAPLRLPVVSTSAFAVAPSVAEPPTMWAMETQGSQFRIVPDPPSVITRNDLEWVRAVFLTGDALMREPAFGRGFALLDGVRWVGDLRAAVILAWTALEAVLRPGRVGMKKTLACCLAAFLTSDRSNRDRIFAHASDAYEQRGFATHDAQLPEAAAAFTTFDLARRFFIACLERAMIPTAEDLLVAWKTGATADSLR